jgi:RNA polymerase sigma factor (sigma-70 family)
MPTLTHPPGSSAPIEYRAATLESRSDEQLVALLRRGRHDAFDALASRYQTRLLWFCWKMLHSKEDAEDALQDVFASAFRALVADDREIQVQPWLYRIARNRCINELRRARKFRPDALGEDHAESGNGPVDGLAIRQRFGELIGDVQALPDKQRTALMLRELDGFAYQQIATAMETTVPGVKSLLVRARIGLRDSSSARDRTPAATAPSSAPRGKRPRTRRSAHPGAYQVAYAAARAAR